MLRRTRFASISAYTFGHPTLDTNFSREVYQCQTTLAAPAPLQRTVLNNGVTVVTHDRRGQMSSVGFFAEAGAKFDPTSAPGLSYVMRWAAMTSNLDESLFQFDRAMRAIGASYGHTEVNKRYIGWISEVGRQSWKLPLEKMQTCLVVPRFAESDVERFRDTFDNLLDEQRWQNPRDYCSTQLEQVAFFKEPLGSPRHVQYTDNDNCSSEQLLAQYCKYMAPQRITVAAVNVEHNELVAHYATLPYQLSHAAPHFRDALLTRSPVVEEAEQWAPLRETLKIEHRCKEMGTHPHQVEDGTIALGYLTYGADKNVRQYATAMVVREILNLATDDAIRTDRGPVHFGTRTFYKPYSSAGLVGLTLRNVAGAKLNADFEAALRIVPDMKVTSAELARAAQCAAVAFFHANLENQRDYLAYIATATFDAESVLKEIAAVTVDDVVAAFAAMNKSKPVTYATGCVQTLPNLRSAINKLNLK